MKFLVWMLATACAIGWFSYWWGERRKKKGKKK